MSKHIRGQEVDDHASLAAVHDEHRYHTITPMFCVLMVIWTILLP